MSADPVCSDSQIVDSLDTLWLMGMKAEYKKARDWVADVLDFRKCVPHAQQPLCNESARHGRLSLPRAQSLCLCRDHESSVFETTIRVLGGLMAAHDLTGDAMYTARYADRSITLAVQKVTRPCKPSAHWLHGFLYIANKVKGYSAASARMARFMSWERLTWTGSYSCMR